MCFSPKVLGQYAFRDFQVAAPLKLAKKKHPDFFSAAFRDFQVAAPLKFNFGVGDKVKTIHLSATSKSRLH